ncbi:MAG: hypothetical protein HY660_18480 [Armatimonadetes bacterium]|nr:hypothetical protein [Armatimonadota bacterium]
MDENVSEPVTCADGHKSAGVAIIYHDALFAQGIASLLRAAGASNVVGVPAADASAEERIRTLRPSVVIVEGEDQDARAHLASLLETAPWVVKVGLDQDTVEIYRRARLENSCALARLVTRLACRGDRMREGRTP